jgi:hypothetical protein
LTENGPFNNDGMAGDKFRVHHDDKQAIPVRMDWFLGGQFLDVFRPCTVVVWSEGGWNEDLVEGEFPGDVTKRTVYSNNYECRMIVNARQL